MRAPHRIHRWVWHTLAHMPGFPLRPRRRRSQKSMPRHRLLLRLEECERRELPGSILAVGAFADVAVVQTTDENAWPGLSLRSPGDVAGVSPRSTPATPGAFLQALDSDTTREPDYNSFSAESARWQFDAADTAPEARPAMFRFAIDETDPIRPAAVAEPEQPLANPLQLAELNDVLALDPLGIGVFAIGTTSATSAAGSAAADSSSGAGGGSSSPSGATASSPAGDSSGTITAIVSPTTASSAPAVASSGTTTATAPANFTSTSTTSSTTTTATASSATSPTSPTPNKPKPKPPGDPLDVLDANTAQTLLPGVTVHGFSTWAMDLRAQVQGGTVQTYSWNLTNAPDATSVTGSSTYRLQFTWASFTGAARTDTILITTTNTDQTQQTKTLTFKVNATDSPAYTATPPTSVSTWPTVVTPDMMHNQATAGHSKYYQLGLGTGELFASHSLPHYDPHAGDCCSSAGALDLAAPMSAGTGNSLRLVYSSLAADQRPMFIYRYQIDPTRAVPPTVKAQLTFNGTQYTAVWYSTSQLNPGDIMEIPLQADAHSLATGRYSWSISVTANYSPTPVTTTQSGSTNIINENGSLFGAGWTLAGFDRLWPVTGGVILEMAAGRSLWFASSGSNFITPAGDFSTLVQNGDSTYMRTLKDGTKYNFSSAGRLTSIVDRNGNTTSFGYDASNRLSTITDFNSLVTNLAYNAAGRVSSITDPASRATNRGYNASNQLTTITDPDTTVMTYGYDTASGRMTSLTDPRSNATTFGYNTNFRINTTTQPAPGGSEPLVAYQMQGIPAAGTGTQGNPATPVLAVTTNAVYTDPRGNQWKSYLDWLGFGEVQQAQDPLSNMSVAYLDANGLPWLSADPLGRRSRNFFDSSGNPTKMVLPDDAYLQATFNSFSEPLTLTDLLGNVTTLQYDTHGNLTQRTDPDPDGSGPLASPVTTMTYTTKGFLSTVTDPLNHTTTLGYDTRSRVTTVTDPANHVTTLGYDTASNITTYTDARNNSWTFTFDNMGRMLTEVEPGTPTATFTFAYDLAGNRTSVTDPLSHSTTSSFNGMEWQSGQTDALNHTWTPAYDANGNLTSITDPLGHAVTYAYDTANRRTSMTDALNHAITYGYDAASQLTTVTDALNHATTYGYSVRGFVTSITDALNNQTQFGYDLDGNRTSVTDPLNHATSYAFDHLNRLLTVTDARNGQVQYAYDGASRLTSLTDPVSNVTQYAYDNANHVITATDPNNHTTQYGYDADYNVTSIIDRNGRQRQFTYDARNHETAEKWLDSQNNVIRTISLGYDNADRLTSVTDPDSSYAYAYDNANRLTSVDNNGTPGIAHVVLTYGYDNANRLTSLGDNLATAGSISYGYDNANRMTSLALSVGGTSVANVSLGYDNANRDTSITRTIGGTGNSISSTIGYDNANRLTSITHSSSVAGTLMSLTYGYDAASRVTTFTGPEGTLNYGYDNTNELTSVTGARSESYGYDLNGNRNTTGYSTTTGNRMTSDGTYNYTYDNEGNVLIKTRISDNQQWVFTWDYRDRLTDLQIKNSSGSVIEEDKFTYDIWDRRIGKWVDADGSGPGAPVQSWTNYAGLDQGGCCGSAFAAPQHHGCCGGGTMGVHAPEGANPYIDFNNSGSVLERYLADPNAIDNFFARYDGTTTAWYLQDMLGSVREIVKTDGTVLDQLTYDSYGNIPTETNASNGDRFKFAGMQWDSEIGQYYAWHREYLAGPARFESEDPLGFRGKDVNLYRYVFNDPVSSTDALGLLSQADQEQIKLWIVWTASNPWIGGWYSLERANKLNAQANIPGNPATNMDFVTQTGCVNSYTGPRTGPGGTAPYSDALKHCETCCGKAFGLNDPRYYTCVKGCVRRLMGGLQGPVGVEGGLPGQSAGPPWPPYWPASQR